jgi:uncharacterized protein YggU (UPF0235/DUF167 family)
MVNQKSGFTHLRVRAYPGSRKESVKKLSAERLSIRVKEPAEGNRANRRILEIVRSLYPGASVRMISGHHSPSKMFEIRS